MLGRLSALILLFWSVAAWPWWLSAVFIILFVFYFANYYEAALAAVFFDVLYYQPAAHAWVGQFWLTIFTLILILFAEWAKDRIVFYR